MTHVYTESLPGGHAHNEDAYEVLSHPQDAGFLLCALADGQGGQSGAAASARLACRSALDAASVCLPTRLTDPAVWADLLRRADNAVARAPDAGFTTLVAFCVGPNFVCGASSGDSALLLVNPNRAHLILTERQRKNPPVGSGAAAFVGFAAELRPPWTLVAMSDGVWKYAGWENVLRIASEQQGEGIISSLRRYAALPRTGLLQDEFTVVLVQDDGT